MDYHATHSAEFDAWELLLIEHLVQDFLASRSSGTFEREDLFQECLLHWWQQRDKYIPSRGASRKTFLRRVIRAKLLDIQRSAQAQKRGGLSQDRYLSEPHGADDENTLAEILEADDPNSDPEASSQLAELRERLLAARDRLSANQRRLVDALQAGTGMSEISRALFIPRSSLYEELNRIRQVFRDAGLEDFFR